MKIRPTKNRVFIRPLAVKKSALLVIPGRVRQEYSNTGIVEAIGSQVSLKRGFEVGDTVAYDPRCQTPARTGGKSYVVVNSDAVGAIIS